MRQPYSPICTLIIAAACLALLPQCESSAPKRAESNTPTATNPAQVTQDNPTGSTSGVAPATDSNSPTATAGDANAVATAVPWPSLDFVNNPGGKDAKAIALSFDDGPDGKQSVEGAAGRSNTSYMLDQLKALGLHATFFVCGNKQTDVTQDAVAQADLRRILQEGHALGSHTLNHAPWDPKTMTLAQATAELTGNQAVMLQPQVLGPQAAPMTLWRAPQGIPFQSTTANVAAMAPAGASAGVHVGWGIDPMDWQCAQTKQDSSCILKNLNEFLDRGASGVILMHSIYKLSAETLPAVVDSIKAHGYHIVMVEDFVRDKYGASSAALAAANAKANFSASDLSNAALAATQKSKWITNTVE